MTPRAPEPGDIPPYRPQLLRDDSTQSKLSIPLSSQSNEADDEQSSDPDPEYDMEDSADTPQYEGEDTRLTSEKELAGFYMYGWAAEVCESSLLLKNDVLCDSRWLCLPQALHFTCQTSGSKLHGAPPPLPSSDKLTNNSRSSLYAGLAASYP